MIAVIEWIEDSCVSGYSVFFAVFLTMCSIVWIWASMEIKSEIAEAGNDCGFYLNLVPVVLIKPRRNSRKWLTSPTLVKCTDLVARTLCQREYYMSREHTSKEQCVLKLNIRWFPKLSSQPRCMLVPAICKCVCVSVSVVGVRCTLGCCKLCIASRLQSLLCSGTASALYFTFCMLSLYTVERDG